MVASEVEDSVLTGYSIPMEPGSGFTSAYTNTLSPTTTTTAPSIHATPTTATATATPVNNNRTLTADEMAEYEAFRRHQQQTRTLQHHPNETIRDDTVYAALPGPPPRLQATSARDMSKSSPYDDNDAMRKSRSYDEAMSSNRNHKSNNIHGDNDDGDGDSGHYNISNPSAPMSSEFLRKSNNNDDDGNGNNYNSSDLPISQHAATLPLPPPSSSTGLNLPVAPSMKEDDLFDALQLRLAALQTGKDPDSEE